MSNGSNKEPDYGNWVSKKLLFGVEILAVVSFGISFWVPLLSILGLIFLIIFGYFLYAQYLFSPSGGNLQERIRDLVLDYLEWDGVGKSLDIGCGNGPLTINMAKKFKDAMLTGIDYWGGMWDYSQNSCEGNAILAGVSERITFRKASPSSLPFEDGHFDAVVSNNVFHEVSDVDDKRGVIKEALRVLKKGGVFSFQDLFLIEKMYGDIEGLLDTIKAWGIEDVVFIRTSDLDFIPWVLKLPFMVGTIGIIYGRK
jgi:SAM-dependent methyltransferase